MSSKILKDLEFVESDGDVSFKDNAILIDELESRKEIDLRFKASIGDG